MKKYSRDLRGICYGGLIAALYVALTAVSSAFGLASGPIQVRISEALCVLTLFTPAAIPGLTVGCLIANLVTGAIWQDVIFGTLATFLGAVAGYFVGRIPARFSKWLVSVPTVVSNTLIMPFVICYGYGAEEGVFAVMLTLGLGELVSAGILGTLLIPIFSRIWEISTNKAE